MNDPKGLISPDEAKTLNDAYTTRHTLISNQITKRPDNRSAWYSLQEIKDYLEYAENQAKEKGYEMDGIRIYCGAYPEEDDLPGYTTSFIVPTASGSLGKDGAGGSKDLTDVDGLNMGGQGNPPQANYPQ